MEFFLGFLEFITQLPVWGEIWCLGAAKAGVRRRRMQIAFGAEFLALFAAALIALTLDAATGAAVFQYVWIGALGAIALQTVLGVVLLIVRRIRKK